MANLTPREAAELVAAGDGYLFFLRGLNGGKGFWAEDLRELVAVLSPELTIETAGRTSRPIEIPGDIINRFGYLLPVNRPDGIVLYSPSVTSREERIARGIALTLGYRFINVDNFLTEEDRLIVPEVIPVAPVDYGVPPAIIVDLDGTLADSHRRPPFSATFEEIVADDVFSHVAEAVHMNHYFGRKILFVSARGNHEGEREATETWLAIKFGIEPGHPDFRLFTRAVGDNRDDVIVKLEIFDRHIRYKYDVKLVLDDRPKVCRLWSELGLPVLCNIDWVKGEF